MVLIGRVQVVVHSFGFAANTVVAPGDDHRKKPPLVGRRDDKIVCVRCCLDVRVRGEKRKAWVGCEVEGR